MSLDQKPHGSSIHLSEAHICHKENKCVVIVDRHPIYREEMRRVLQAHLERRSCVSQVLLAGKSNELQLHLSNQSDVDLIILDLSLSDESSILNIKKLRADYDQIPIVVVSNEVEFTVIDEAYASGALAFIPKSESVETLLFAIDRALDGEIWRPRSLAIASKQQLELYELQKRVVSLSDQQKRVLLLLAKGYINRQIANELGITEATIKAHVTGIFVRMKVNSRTQAVVLLLKLFAVGMSIN